MTFAVPLIVKLCSLLLLLVIIGDVTRSLGQRVHLAVPPNCDLAQTAILDIALGCLTIYLIALLLTPLHLFNHSAVIAIAVVFPLVRLWLSRDHLRSVLNKKAWLLSPLRKLLAEPQLMSLLVLCLVFLVSLTFQIIPLVSDVLGSFHDAAMHSLVTELIIENHGFPATHEPYLPAIMKMPLGTHTLFAFTSMLFGLLPEKAVLYVTPFFSALVIFGAYYLGKTILNAKLGIVLALIIGFAAQYPIGITWGGNTLALGLFLCLILVGTFLQCFLLRNTQTGNTKLGIVILLGLLLGYLGTVHITICLLAIITLLFIDAMTIITKSQRTKEFCKLVGLHSFMGLAALLPLGIWIYRFLFLPNITAEPVVDYSEVWRKFSYEGAYEWGQLFPANIIFNPLRHWQIYRIWWDWYISERWVGSYFILPLAFAFPALVLIGFMIDRNRGRLGLMLLCFLPFLAVLLMSQNTPQGLFFTTAGPFAQVIAEADKLVIWLIVSLSILAAGSVIYLHMLLRLFLMKIKQVPSGFRQGITYLPFCGLAIACLICVPSNMRILNERYQYASENDYRLLLWMQENLDKSAVVFTTGNDAGSYIPAVCHLKAVYPYSGSPERRDIYPRYRRLCEILQSGDFGNPEFAELLQEKQIGFIFIGEVSLSPSDSLDPSLFQSRPDLFRVTERIGNAFLFACNQH